MNVFLAGATGLVGAQLLELLLADERIERVTIAGRRSLNHPHPKLTDLVVDFDRPDDWADAVRADVLFSAMGTTLKKAGSHDAQYRVDYTYQYNLARVAKANGVSRYVLVSSSGASPRSKMFYSRIKGELDEAVLKLGFGQTTILRPSLLLGNRTESRPFEKLAQRVMPVLTRFVFRRYRPIDAQTVARAMLAAALAPPSNPIVADDTVFALAKAYR